MHKYSKEKSMLYNIILVLSYFIYIINKKTIETAIQTNSDGFPFKHL